MEYRKLCGGTIPEWMVVCGLIEITNGFVLDVEKGVANRSSRFVSNSVIPISKHQIKRFALLRLNNC